MYLLNMTNTQGKASNNIFKQKKQPHRLLQFLNIHLRGKIVTPPLLPNNHHHITNYPVGVVFGLLMSHWVMPKYIFNYPEKHLKTHYSSSLRKINEKNNYLQQMNFSVKLYIVAYLFYSPNLQNRNNIAYICCVKY